jgi:hypothetical protein
MTRVAEAVAAQMPFFGFLGVMAFYKVSSLSRRVRKLERQWAERQADVETVR